MMVTNTVNKIDKRKIRRNAEVIECIMRRLQNRDKAKGEKQEQQAEELQLRPKVNDNVRGKFNK